MTTPVAERIVAVIADRLEEITKANGYPIDATVTRATRTGTSPTDNRIYVSIDNLETNDLLSYQSNPPVIGWDVLVRCSFVATPAETTSTPLDTFRMQAYAAMAQAVTAPADWYRFTESAGTPPVLTNLAVNARIESPELMRNAEQGQAGCHLIVRAMFRTDEDDPTVVRS